MKRLIDFVIALLALIVLSPLLLLISLLIFLYDFKSPFYVAPRVARGGGLFRMVKFRSMVVNADKTGVTSTSATDRRITPVGHFVRRYKLDELVQLWNVVCGDMSLVGPRPNVKSGTDAYSAFERRLLTVRPGITDFASIVFADEGEILKGHPDADLAYDQLIRPWKSRLGVVYVENSAVRLDLLLILLTVLALYSRAAALRRVSSVLSQLGAPADLVEVSLRRQPLVATAGV